MREQQAYNGHTDEVPRVKQAQADVAAENYKKREAAGKLTVEEKRLKEEKNKEEAAAAAVEAYLKRAKERSVDFTEAHINEWKKIGSEFAWLIDTIIELGSSEYSEEEIGKILKNTNLYTQ
jgi:phage terminase Nu1 subunit (DNA packaging protein)